MNSKPRDASAARIVAAPLSTVVRSPRHERPWLLVVGNDRILLSYREEVLKVAGFAVTSICLSEQQPHSMRGPETHGSPAVCIVCHTLDHEQRIAVVTQLRQDYPSSKLLILTASYVSMKETASYDAVMKSPDGPAALIRLLNMLLQDDSREDQA